MAEFKIILVGASSEDHLFWSNEIGWVDWDSSDSFSEREVMMFNLPIGGKWISVGK
jgi:hypothetical protein